jgi:hypothetical protein
MQLIGDQNLKTRFLITSEKSETAISNRIVGSAFQVEGHDNMTIHLRILPGITFFLAKNWSGFPEYIIFSGRALKENGRYRFFHRVGSGYKASNENVIELSLPDLGQTFYIQLDPADYHYDNGVSVKVDAAA